jgi:toxin-antitoxin system PIN domain toxin
VHHLVANDWLESLDIDVRFCFCRFTQLGFLRLLTAQAVMGAEDVLTQTEAWNAYDRWSAKEHVVYFDEPAGLESRFRELSRSRQASPQAWADAYLAAFADAAQLALVTFDTAFRGKAKRLILLAE